MNRKQFISSLVAAGIIIPSVNSNVFSKEKKPSRVRIPPYLTKGSTIGITSPANYSSLEDIEPAVKLMESWGFNIAIGKTIGQRYFTLGGTDEQRAADFQEMLDNPDIHAIMCARGGYGAVRIIDSLDFSRFVANPKWIIGFSDITAFHCHINQRYNVASIHSKMCNSFPSDWNTADPVQVETILSIKKLLMGEEMYYISPPSEFNRYGSARGQLVGGNLSIIQSLNGSRSDIKTKGKILFVEDVSEYLYNIDRMFYNLSRSGKFTDLAGLIVGGFRLKADDPGSEFGETIQDIVMNKVKEYNYPVCFDFPVGHQKNNFALTSGAEHLLTVNHLGGILQT